MADAEPDYSRFQAVLERLVDGISLRKFYAITTVSSNTLIDYLNGKRPDPVVLAKIEMGFSLEGHELFNAAGLPHPDPRLLARAKRAFVKRKSRAAEGPAKADKRDTGGPKFRGVRFETIDVLRDIREAGERGLFKVTLTKQMSVPSGKFNEEFLGVLRDVINYEWEIDVKWVPTEEQQLATLFAPYGARHCAAGVVESFPRRSLGLSFIPYPGRYTPMGCTYVKTSESKLTWGELKRLSRGDNVVAVVTEGDIGHDYARALGLSTDSLTLFPQPSHEPEQISAALDDPAKGVDLSERTLDLEGKTIVYFGADDSCMQVYKQAGGAHRSLVLPSQDSHTPELRAGGFYVPTDLRLVDLLKQGLSYTFRQHGDRMAMIYARYFTRVFPGEVPVPNVHGYSCMWWPKVDGAADFVDELAKALVTELGERKGGSEEYSKLPPFTADIDSAIKFIMAYCKPPPAKSQKGSSPASEKPSPPSRL